MDAAERESFIASQASLAHLVEKSSLLIQRAPHEIVAHHKIETPLKDELPDPHELIRRVLGTVSMRHVWAGGFDVHHLAWPGCDYRQIDSVYGDKVASVYRGMGRLKMSIPRQLHNYIHAITEPPPLPDRDLMASWAAGYESLNNLYCTVREENLEALDMPEEEKEWWRFNNFQAKLEALDERAALHTDIEVLRSLEDAQIARRALRAIVKPRWYGNSRSTQRNFFAEQRIA